MTIKTLAQEFYGHLWYVLLGRHRKARGRAQNILISLFFSISMHICCCSDSKLAGRTLYIYIYTNIIYIYIRVTIKTPAQEFYRHWWYVLPGRHRKARGRAQNILVSLFFSISVNICCCSDAKLVGRTEDHMGREDQSDQQRHKSWNVF